ncbi:MAG: CoB--CoM heterodisulfide reductase iron-sulfur subunit A family protein [Bacteroidales bacterium]|nr:CoB--CoM heterodisulfide reductase iron-sulfur subunit A family protein [Bacteroidales bacterium]
MKQTTECIIIGGGPAGLQAAGRLAGSGCRVLVLEKEQHAGGKLNQWDKLFPDLYDAEKLKAQLLESCSDDHVEILTGAEAAGVVPEGNGWKVTLKDNRTFTAPSILLCTGFEPFDATRKEEYGYGIYPNVITSVNLEQMIGQRNIRTQDGRVPQSIAYIQCVGSRDEKVNNHYCSVNCCICAVKQCIEVRQLLPSVSQHCFYMDLRMTGQHYEELYRESQEKHHVNFIRGRVSETALSPDGRIRIKAEDTLLSRPVTMSTDLLVLMVGMEPSPSTKKFSADLQISDPYGFLLSADHEAADNITRHPGIFVAGSCKRPMAIPKTRKDADAAAWEILQYLKRGAQ